MSETVLVALLALCGTLVGSAGGILTANRMTNYRIEQLEKRVEKHNSTVERTFALEGRMTAVERDIRGLKGEKNSR